MKNENHAESCKFRISANTAWVWLLWNMLPPPKAAMMVSTAKSGLSI